MVTPVREGQSHAAGWEAILQVASSNLVPPSFAQGGKERGQDLEEITGDEEEGAGNE